ncbi:MAG TPA: cytochrome c biogenesis protein CcdA, partial [Gaiellaceae bacterium]|nr:cytochrome c biogenesis protein CcdA [Gaiellaceae bacterium]
MVEKLPIAFLAGLLSVLTPCVLPLVPGYLSAVSAVEVDRLGERGVSKRVVLASVPFVIGFTAVFVLL